MARLGRGLVAGFAVALVLPAGDGARSAPPSLTFSYTISHPVVGDMGTYTNTIIHDGGRIMVDTRLEIAAKIMFITVHRVEAERHEVWRDERLVSFASQTDDNGSVSRVSGRAEADGFVIDGPAGEQIAPADVVPANPWSLHFTRARTIMDTTRGNLAQVAIAEREMEQVQLGDRTVLARHFVVIGGGGGEVWYDSAGVPVKFAFESNSADVSFTLR